MKHVSILLLLCLLAHGFPGRNEDGVAVFVKERDSVTLHSDTGTELRMRSYGYIKWWFHNTVIAEMHPFNRHYCTDVQCNEGSERFRDRLKLDHQTGSLTITNITNTDTGLYEQTIVSYDLGQKIFIVAVRGFLGVGKNGISAFVMEGDSVTIHTNVETSKLERMEWYFKDSLIAQITGDQSKICTDVQCNEGNERFRDRLKMDNQTGSLTITNTTNTDTGLYRVTMFYSSSSSGTSLFSVAVHGFPGRNEDGVAVFVKERDSVTLHSDTGTELRMRSYGYIKWWFHNTVIAEMHPFNRHYCTDVQCNEGSERFRDRLKLDHQTGSLTITNITNTDTGLYEQTIVSYDLGQKIFIVAVRGFLGVGKNGISAFVMEGDSVTIHTNVETSKLERMEWYFKDSLIAQITGDQSKICTDVQCNEGNERFRDRLKMDNQTGSLTITNTTNTDTGLYRVTMFYSSSSSGTSLFSVAVHGVSAAERDTMKIKSVKEGEPVTLDPGVTKSPNDSVTWYFNDILIAEITGDQSQICTDDQCKERFRDRLKLDHQTGSLTITNTTNTDSGDYTVKIIISKRFRFSVKARRISIIRSFSVTVTGFPGLNEDGVPVFVKKEEKKNVIYT